MRYRLADSHSVLVFAKYSSLKVDAHSEAGQGLTRPLLAGMGGPLRGMTAPEVNRADLAK